MIRWLIALSFVLGSAALAQTPIPTITPNAAQDCCDAWSSPGCNDSVCETCVCQGNGIIDDPYCCDVMWDFQCSEEAKGLVDPAVLPSCFDECACAQTPVPTGTVTPSPSGTPPTATATPTGTARPQDCCDCTGFAQCVQGSCNVLCPDLTPPVLHRDQVCFPEAIPGSGNCVVPTPLTGQVIIEEDTPTVTPVPGTRTPTPSRTPTRTPPVCCGDCNHDLSVSDAEVATCSNIFTGAEPLSDCPDCDCNSDGSVRSDELTRIALNHPACRTDTPTPTPTSSRQDCCECPEANCSIPPVNGTCPQGCTLIPNACCNCGGGGKVGRTPTPVCCGDCNGDSQVRNNELTLAIDINNGSQPIAACPPANCDGLDGVSDNDLSIIAGNFTNGCPATRTPGGSTAVPRPTTTPTPVRGQ